MPRKVDGVFDYTDKNIYRGHLIGGSHLQVTSTFFRDNGDAAYVLHQNKKESLTVALRRKRLCIRISSCAVILFSIPLDAPGFIGTMTI